MKRIWVIGMLVLGIIIGGSAHVTARQSQPAPFRGTVHVVKPGESLWKIAERAYPGDDLRERIAEIRNVNRLRGGAIMPGQSLKLPAR